MLIIYAVIRVTPAFILITSAWYSRKDQAVQMGIWYSSNGSCQVIGGLLAYGFGQIHVSGFSSWKWLYVVTGTLSISWAVALYLFLPDSQLTATFLSTEEKRAAIEMVRENNTGIHGKIFKKEQLKEAICDVKAWALFFMALLTTTSNSITTVRIRGCIFVSTN
jgi:ACS family allantoate permease-like MFS transporter